MGIFKRNPKNTVPESPASQAEAPTVSRFRAGLQRTRKQFASGLGNLFLGKKQIDGAILEQLETQLLLADVGVEATQTIIGDLTARVERKELDDTATLVAALRQELVSIIAPRVQPLTIQNAPRPFVILMVGVNGAGKTTTIGKLAKQFQQAGHRVMLAAGDTFRAAAVEQLRVWGERKGVR